MRKTKAKRESFWRKQMLPFVVVWTIGAVLVKIMSSTLVNFLSSMTQQSYPEVSTLTSVIGIGLLQVFLVERLLKKSMRGWMLYTALSALAILILNEVFLQLFFGPTLFLRTILDNYQPLSSFALNVPTALLQAFWLRQRVHRAWLWPLLTIPLLVISTEIQYGQQNYGLLKMILFLSVGVVQAALMHYFWQHPKQTENTHIDFAEDDESSHEPLRLERLQERDQQTPLWDVDDDQVLQSEA